MIIKIYYNKNGIIMLISIRNKKLKPIKLIVI